MASVFLSCCAPELNFLSGGGGDMATSPLTTPMNSETQSTDNIVGGSSSNNDGENEGKVGRSNVWSEKAQREERGKEDYSEDGRQQQRLHHDVDGGKKSPDFPNIGILPLACGQHLPKNKSPNKPFASTTLLDRGDSLLEQGSLLSLMASESETPLSSSHHCHFPKEDENDNDDYSAEGTQHGEDKSLFSTTNPVTNIDIHTTPPRPTRQELSTPSAPPPSPAMELSMAKQEANVAQLSNTRLHAREGLRSFRDMSSAINSSPRSLRTHKEEKDIETVNNKQSLAAGDGSVGSKAVTTEINDDANKSARATMYSSFGNAEPTPLWEIDGVNSELKCTYQYPRLYLKDPAHVITNHKRALVDNEQGEFWWYHLAQRMETTLGHVCGHWKLLEQQKQQANLNSSDSVSVSSSVNTNAILERNENGFKHDSENGCSDAMVDLCFGKQTQTNHHRSKSWSKLKSKNKVVDNSNVMNHAMSSNSSVNAWSEPCASTMKVRGPKYSKNGMKVDSNESIFAVLGVDNFVNGRDGGCVDHDSSKAGPATCNYLDRWKRVCDDVGLEQPPFL